jgi:hypothetical protein
MSRLRLPMVLIASCSVAALAGAAFADPPGRVGRVSDVEGVVSFLPPDGSDWSEALRNFPVTSGEAFWTGDSGRAELQLGGVQARLDSETEFDVVDVDYGQTRFSVPQGSVDIRLWRVPEGGVTVSTPAGDVQLNQAGAFRIDVGAPNENGDYPPVEVTALDGGDAGAPGPDGFVDVPDGAAAVIYAGYDPQLVDAMDADIDDWARDREAKLRYDQVNWQQESEPGYADLSNYGRFVQDPTYGQVWYPTQVPPDWAPYRFGQWSYVQPWGWTWIDDQPWGFAPFHYGRWAVVGGRWGWVPGEHVARPVYAPALVAFIGGGGFGVGVGAGGGVFAWAPLAPDEAYIPPYQASQAYMRRVNVANVSTTVVNNITVNSTTVVDAGHLRNAAAVSAISTDSLARGAKVDQASVHVTPQALAQARVAPSSALPPAPPRPSGPNGARGASAGAGSSGLHAAPPPPAKVQQLRAAVAHAPPGSTAPPPKPLPPKPPGGPNPPPPAGSRPPPPALSRPLPPGHTTPPTGSPEMRRPPAQTPPPSAGTHPAPPATGAGEGPPAVKPRVETKPTESAPPPQPQERLKPTPPPPVHPKPPGPPPTPAAHAPAPPLKTAAPPVPPKPGPASVVHAPVTPLKTTAPPVVRPKAAPAPTKPPAKQPPDKKDDQPNGPHP